MQTVPEKAVPRPANKGARKLLYPSQAQLKSITKQHLPVVTLPLVEYLGGF